MRLIDADVLLDNIRRDSKKAIDEGDKVGSFWLGYAAGLVIKQPTIQSALDPETLIRTIETGITATNSSDAYSLGMRNGMRWCKSLIDGVEPKFEEMSVDNGKDLPTVQPEPTYEQVEEYCKRRCLHVVTADFFESTKPQRLGHWILYDKRFPWRTWYKCSECGNYLDFSGVNGGRGEANYCPNCGARMTTSTK